MPTAGDSVKDRSACREIRYPWLSRPYGMRYVYAGGCTLLATLQGWGMWRLRRGGRVAAVVVDGLFLADANRLGNKQLIPWAKIQKANRTSNRRPIEFRVNPEGEISSIRIRNVFKTKADADAFVDAMKVYAGPCDKPEV